MEEFSQGSFSNGMYSLNGYGFQDVPYFNDYNQRRPYPTRGGRGKSYPPSSWKKPPRENTKPRKKKESSTIPPSEITENNSVNFSDPSNWPSLDEASTKESQQHNSMSTNTSLPSSNNLEINSNTNGNNSEKFNRASKEVMSDNSETEELDSKKQEFNSFRPTPRGRSSRGKGVPPPWRGSNFRGRGRGRSAPYFQPTYNPVPFIREEEFLLLYQIEYYFSVENLCKDLYLRRNMDFNGWVPIPVIADFNRVKSLALRIIPNGKLEDIVDLIAYIVEQSTKLELSPNRFTIRLRDNWQDWTLPISSPENDLWRPPPDSDETLNNTHNNSSNIIEQPSSPKSDEGTITKEIKSDNVQTSSDNVQTSSDSSEKKEKPISHGWNSIDKVLQPPKSQQPKSKTPESSGALKNSSKDTSLPSPSQPLLDTSSSFEITNKPKSSNKKTEKKEINGTSISEKKTDEGEWITATNRKKRNSNPPQSTTNNSNNNNNTNNNTNTNSTKSKKGTTTGQPSSPPSPKKDESNLNITTKSNQTSINEFDDSKISQLSLFIQLKLPEPKNHFNLEHINSINQGLESYEKSLSGNGTVKSAISHFYGVKHSPLVEHKNSIQVGWILLPKEFSSDDSSIPNFQHISHNLLIQNGFSQCKYITLLSKSIEERKDLGKGKSPLMNILYKFWSHFLRHQFNKQMYNDFKKFALEDLAEKFSVGINNLVRFYNQVLQTKFKQELFDDFQQIALKDIENGNSYSLKKLNDLKSKDKSGKLTILPDLLQAFQNGNDCEKKTSLGTTKNANTNNAWFSKKLLKQ